MKTFLLSNNQSRLGFALTFYCILLMAITPGFSLFPIISYLVMGIMFLLVAITVGSTFCVSALGFLLATDKSPSPISAERREDTKVYKRCTFWLFLLFEWSYFMFLRDQDLRTLAGLSATLSIVDIVNCLMVRYIAYRSPHKEPTQTQEAVDET